MASIKIPYLQLRNGRPRWEPGPGLRDKGWHGRDLKDEAGQWLGLEAAIAAAGELNAKVAAWRAGDRPRLKPPVPRKHPRSLEALADLWLASPRFERRAAKTQRDYKSKLSFFLDEFGHINVAALETPHLHRYWEELYRDRGHAMANGTLAVVRAMLSHARRVGWRADNPARMLGLETVPPRIVVWTPAEVAHLVELADAGGRHSVGDAVLVALHTGQRQGDVLTLEMPQIEGGRARFAPSKTFGRGGGRVSVPLTPQLEARIAAIKARRAAAPVASLDTARLVILAEDTGRPYNSSTFGYEFRPLRTQAAERFPDVAAKWFSDLRDTAVTRMALAGCPISEIRAITGHSLETVHQVLKHYLALDERSAAAGIERLKVWMAEEGIAV